MKDWDGKMSEKKDEIFGDNCLVKDLGSNYFDAYSIVAQEGKSVRVTLWINLGGAFMNSKDHPVQYNYFSSALRNFAVAAAKNFVQEQIDDANKVLGDYQQHQNDLIKKNEDLHKQISDCEASIKQANDDLAENGKDQASAKEQIANQQKVVDALQAKMNGIQ